MENWITADLKQKIRKVFEPRYKRNLLEEDILAIASNLTTVIEEIIKFKWKKAYERHI